MDSAHGKFKFGGALGNFLGYFKNIFDLLLLEPMDFVKYGGLTAVLFLDMNDKSFSQLVMSFEFFYAFLFAA